jgi:gliding motility-associated lipoprotein GldH
MKLLKLQILLAIMVVVPLVFTACSKAPVFEKSIKMKNTVWDRFDIKQYDVAIAEAGKSYDIEVVVRCTEGFQYEKLPFYVILTSPSGEERMREVTVPVRENSKLITNVETSKAESRLMLWKGIKMADKGTCKITLENMIPKIQTEGIDEIAIVVTEAKK